MGSSLVHCLCLIFLLRSTTQVQSLRRVFDVNNYGAIADGKTDNAKAILSAWNDACRYRGGGVVLIPKAKGIYLMSNVDFIGPCKSQMLFILKGILRSTPYQPHDRRNSGHWIAFRYVDNLIITGGGSLDGQGPTAWPYRNCRNCMPLPIALRLDFVRRARVSYIKLFNSMNFHITIFSSFDINIHNLHISSPGDSPNTDGIHLGDSTAINITSSVIATGDDCISFGSGMRDVYVRGVHCGPGHGISIGSLGKYPNEKDVLGFVVRNCSFSGTQNGLRIKTWAKPSNPIRVYNVTFEHITMDHVNNPIIIDQEYCPSGKCSHQGDSQVQIRDVQFRNIQGTSSSKIAVNFICSKSKPCDQIKLRNIRLSYHGKDGHETSQCSNAHGVASGYEHPQSCLN